MRPEPSIAKHRTPVWPGYVGCLIAALVVYLVSMAPGVVWQDNGLIQIRTLQRDLFGRLGLALSHPLFYCIAIAFQYLPFHESAFKTNLVSVLFGSITVANVLLLLRLITSRWPGAIVGTISLAVAHTFWQHCALPETYTLTVALLTTELICFYQYIVTGRSGWLMALFAVNGLGISNHMLASLSLACYSVYVLYLVIRGRFPVGRLPQMVLFWMLGASLYLSMIAWRIAAGDGVEETVRSALFGNYMQNALNVLLTRHLLFNSVMYLGINFPTPLVLLCVPGMQSLTTGHTKVVRNMIAVLLVVYLVWAVRYDIVDQYTFFIPAVVLLAIVFGLGADRFLQHHPTRGWVFTLMAAAVLPAAIYAVLPQIARATHLPIGISRDIPYRDKYDYFLQPWKTGYHGAERFATELCEQLPPGAVLLADSTTVRPIQYLQLTGQWPEEMTILPPLPCSGTSMPSREWLETAAREHRLYVVSNIAPYCPDWVLENYVLVPYGPIYHVAAAEPDSKAATELDNAGKWNG